jgi:hypothetical protein
MVKRFYKKLSIYENLSILRIPLLDKTPIKELLTNEDYQDVKELNRIQLNRNPALRGGA